MSNKVLASAIVFVFTNLVFPSAIASEDAKVVVPPQEKPGRSPDVELGVPRAVKADGDTVTIRSVNPHHTLLQQVEARLFSFDHSKVAVAVYSYGSEAEGFVSLHPTDLETGLVQIGQPQNALEKNVAAVLAHPEVYKVRGDLVSTQMEPKIISDARVGGHLLAMQAWDFRLAHGPHYNSTSINQIFINAYSTFKAYRQIAKKQHPGKPVVIHTSYWGVGYFNSARLTTAIQLVAAELAGVDKLIFHINPAAQGDAQVLFDAEDFVSQQNGKNIGTIMANMLKKTAQPGWQAGVSRVTAKASDFVDSSLVANDY